MYIFVFRLKQFNFKSLNDSFATCQSQVSLLLVVSLLMQNMWKTKSTAEVHIPPTFKKLKTI